jgi:hypothetical protein
MKKAAAIGIVSVLLLTGGAIAVWRRPHSRFEFLYALGPDVKEFRPSSISHGLMRGVYVMTRRGATSLGSTLFVFPPETNARLGRELHAHFGLPENRDWTAPAFSARVTADSTLMIATGSAAQEVATTVGVPCAPGSAAIIVSEPPDWFTARLHGLLRFLRVG